ncbi:hypothetical protein Hanom_Chr09g00765281 [Helianthus anomalus]
MNRILGTIISSHCLCLGTLINRDELGTFRYRKNRYQKSLKVSTGTEYNGFGTVRYRYLRVKTGKYRYRTESVPKMLKVGTESVPKRYSVR